MAGNKANESEDIEKPQDSDRQESSGDVPPIAPNELTIKHPLQNTWTLWYYEHDKKKSWMKNQCEITSFDTVEDFWRLGMDMRSREGIQWQGYNGGYVAVVYRPAFSNFHLFNHIKSASEIRHGCDYSLFKQGIRPMWEDDANKEGGRWLINLEKKQRENELDSYWMEIILCMIGEAFDEYSDEICGAVVSVRMKGDKIGVWTADAEKRNGEGVLAIGRKLKERLKLNTVIGYQVHKDTMVKAGASIRNTYHV